MQEQATIVMSQGDEGPNRKCLTLVGRCLGRGSDVQARIAPVLPLAVLFYNTPMLTQLISRMHCVQAGKTSTTPLPGPRANDV